MKSVLILGSSSLLASRLHHHLHLHSVPVSTISLRPYLDDDIYLSSLRPILESHDVIFNFCGPNSSQLQAQPSLGKLLHQHVPSCLLQASRESGSTYYQISSYHSVSEVLVSGNIASPFDCKPISIYASSNNKLERILFSTDRSPDNYIIRISNCFGPPSPAANFSPKHWMTISNSFAYSIALGTRIIIDSPQLIRPFLPTLCFLNFCLSIVDGTYVHTNSSNVIQLISPFEISLESMFNYQQIIFADASTVSATEYLFETYGYLLLSFQTHSFLKFAVSSLISP